jgi:hypothetical protein
MRRVILESPFAALTPEGIDANITYARRCLLDSLRRGEAPIASHLLYPQVLDDSIPEERKLGISAGWEWLFVAAAVVVYMDRGVSDGMRKGIAAAEDAGRPVQYRWIEDTDTSAEAIAAALNAARPG